MAFVPGLPRGQQRQQTWPSTVAYLARLIIHRYAMLGALDEKGFPLQEMGILQVPVSSSMEAPPMAGSRCPECGNATMITRTAAISAPPAGTSAVAADPSLRWLSCQSPESVGESRGHKFVSILRWINGSAVDDE